MIFLSPTKVYNTLRDCIFQKLLSVGINRSYIYMASCIAFFTYEGLREFMQMLNLLGCHWLFNYPGPLLDVELESTCLSG